MKRKFVREQRRKKYVPGTLGISSVSEDIRDDYGSILSRRERRLLRKQGVPFRPVRSY